VILVRIAHVPVGGDQTGSKTSGALLELGIGSYVKSRTLIYAAQRVSVRSSGNYSAWLVSYGIPVDVGEAGWGKWEGGSGIFVESIVKIELGHFGAEV
jgi:hypothetical protein